MGAGVLERGVDEAALIDGRAGHVEGREQLGRHEVSLRTRRSGGSPADTGRELSMVKVTRSGR